MAKLSLIEARKAQALEALLEKVEQLQQQLERVEAKLDLALAPKPAAKEPQKKSD